MFPRESRTANGYKAIAMETIGPLLLKCPLTSCTFNRTRRWFVQTLGGKVHDKKLA